MVVGSPGMAVKLARIGSWERCGQEDTASLYRFRKARIQPENLSPSSLSLSHKPLTDGDPVKSTGGTRLSQKARGVWIILVINNNKNKYDQRFQPPGGGWNCPFSSKRWEGWQWRVMCEPWFSLNLCCSFQATLWWFISTTPNRERTISYRRPSPQFIQVPSIMIYYW